MCLQVHNKRSISVYSIIKHAEPSVRLLEEWSWWRHSGWSWRRWRWRWCSFLSVYHTEALDSLLPSHTPSHWGLTIKPQMRHASTSLKQPSCPSNILKKITLRCLWCVFKYNFIWCLLLSLNLNTPETELSSSQTQQGRSTAQTKHCKQSLSQLLDRKWYIVQKIINSLLMSTDSEVVTGSRGSKTPIFYCMCFICNVNGEIVLNHVYYALFVPLCHKLIKNRFWAKRPFQNNHKNNVSAFSFLLHVITFCEGTLRTSRHHRCEQTTSKLFQRLEIH